MTAGFPPVFAAVRTVWTVWLLVGLLALTMTIAWVKRRRSGAFRVTLALLTLLLGILALWLGPAKFGWTNMLQSGILDVTHYRTSFVLAAATALGTITLMIFEVRE